MSNRMWGGRFSDDPSEIMEEINSSIEFDKKLFKQDIDGSKAHARMLAARNIISDAESNKIIDGLDTILSEIEGGSFEFSRALEDIHMNVEARLTVLIGPVAGKLHTARSRNDQVATDFRLWVRDSLDNLDRQLWELQSELVRKAEHNTETAMPGFTHLQSAQPVTFGHHLMAYVEMIGRDRGRIKDARNRLNESPLGSAALAGTSFPINRDATAKALGFEQPMANSLDAVSDRDFIIESLSAASLCAMHLSRFAEEIVIWSSAQFNFIILSDAFTSGSSIMPQKKNPDAAELVRAKTGRIYGALVALLTVMKGLPLAYSKDMQEDKEKAFDSLQNLSIAISAMTGMVKDMETNATEMAKAAGSGYSTATDLADWCVRVLGLPFREAHHITGQIVALAEEKKSELHCLSLEDMQKIDSRISSDVFSVLSVENSINSRTSYGGTAPSRVQEQIQRWKDMLESDQQKFGVD